VGKSNVYQIPSESVAVYLDRYTAQRLLLALTQALEPANGDDYYKKKSKKGKGQSSYSGMKLSKKGKKDAMMCGLKLTKGGEPTGVKMVLKGAIPKASLPAPKPAAKPAPA
jgi:hypothetical protein